MIGESNFATDEQIADIESFKDNDILNLLPAAVYVCDLSGQILHYNKKAVEFWGRTPKMRDKDDRFCGAFKLYLADGTYMPHDKNPMAACLKDGIPRKDLEVIIERPNSSRIVVKVNVTPVRNNNGELVGALNCFYDITDQKEAQKELDWKTRELLDYVDNASIGLHWVDERGFIKWANNAELDMLGYSESEYIGHHISEFHLDQDKINDILYRLSCNETLNSYESALRCKDGSARIVQISSSVFWDEGKFIHTRCFTIDVTEQQELYQALVSSERRYKSLISTLPAGVYTCDKDGRITYFNEAAVKLWGYTPDINTDSLKFCACYKVWMMDGTFIPPEHTPMAIALTAGKTFRNVEALVERPDGSKFYANVNIDPLLDENGAVVGAINIFQDITEAKLAEIAIKESESKYRHLIQTLNTPLYTTDAQGRITLYNKAAVALWGREPEIGKDLWCGSYKIKKTDGSNLPLDSCPMAICLKEQRAVIGEEILVIRPDNSVRNVAPHPQPLFDNSGNLVGAINMLVDITNIREAEKSLLQSEQNYRALAASLEKKVIEKTKDLVIKNEELRKSEERYHRMVEEVEDYAIILLDENGIIQNWNKGAEKIKGYSEKEIIGKSFEVFYLKEDREQGLPQKLIEEARTKGKATIEGWRLRRDSSKFWGSIVITALHGESGNIIGFTKMTRDLTDKKKAEDRLIEYSTELEFQNKELEQFAYAASHDMKEPLRKIHLYSAYIKDNKSNILDERSREYLDRCLNAVTRMGDLLEDLLAYSRTTSTTGYFAEVDFSVLVNEIISEHTDELTAKGIKVEIEELPVVNAVPFQCKQLMHNLLHNSIKYTQSSQKNVIRITGRLVKGSGIKGLKAGRDKEYYQVSIEDTGVGFEQEYAEKIFDVFQRLDNLPQAKGSGIGLAICKKIVQNHKGHIAATGKLNKGAKFDVYFPKVD